MFSFRKIKPKKHDLRDAGYRSLKDFYRAVKCVDCGKSFVMDVFGGWSMEWNYKIDKHGFIEEEDFAAAISYMHKTPSGQWTQLDNSVCET